MSKLIQVNGFAIFSPVHLSPGLWRHPDDRSLDFSTLDYWTDVAKILEAGKFDSIFIADGIGIHDVYAGTADAALNTGAQIPKLDPMLLVSAMAHVTEHLGLGVTAPVSYEPLHPGAPLLDIGSSEQGAHRLEYRHGLFQHGVARGRPRQHHGA